MNLHKKKSQKKKHRREIASLLFVVFFLTAMFAFSQPKAIVAETDRAEAAQKPAQPSPPADSPKPTDTHAPADTSKPTGTHSPVDTRKPAGTHTPVITHRPAETPQITKTPKPVSTPKTSDTQVCQIHRSTAGIKKVHASITYNGKKISLKNTPLIQYKGVIMSPISPVFVTNGPKADYEFNKSTKHVRIVRQNKLVTFYINGTALYHSGQKMTLPVPAVNAVYTKTQKKEKMAPFLELCQALDISCHWNASRQTYVLKGKQIRFPGKKTHTKYAYSRKTFAKKEYRTVRRVPYRTYLRLVTPSKDTTANFKFLRVDRYRPVNEKLFRQYYQYLIEDYCRERDISAKKSSLYNKSDIFLKAARQYDLDPVYLVSQTFLESAYGTSDLASGNVIKKIAYRNFSRKRNGKFRTKKLKTRTKVYNLYGIKAYDADPFVGGTSYAYYQGWTSVERAIYGAARYLDTNYIRGDFRQNTIFKMRFTFRKSIWHQYATSPEYAENIGFRNYLMSDCYSNKATFLYDFPKYR